MTIILNPVAPPRDSRGARMPLIHDLAGKTIGILSNHWQSMDRMAARIELQLKGVYQAADVRFYDVPINGAMSDAVRAAAVAECDAAIVGLAN
jgi:hypothetical protein